MRCPSCGECAHRVCYLLRSYTIVQCSSCGLLYNRNCPDPQEAPRAFSEAYYHDVQREAFAHVGDPSREDASRAIYERGLDYVEQRAGIGTLLDVGCAFGTFMGLAASRGWSVQGVEISSYSSHYAREKRGLDVFTGDLLNAPVRESRFDLVTMWDVLEHVIEPRKTLKRAAAVLKPGGHLMLTTDNYRSLLSFMSDAIYRISLGAFTYPIERFFIRYNSCYFTPEDVRKMLRSVRLEEVHFEGIDYPIEKINLGRVERSVLRTLYRIGDLIKMNSQFLVLAQKRNTPE